MIQRKLDELGRVLIPEEMTRKLGISSKTLLNIHLDGERIIIEKTGDSCLFCGNSENVIDGFHVCRSCAQKPPQPGQTAQKCEHCVDTDKEP